MLVLRYIFCSERIDDVSVDSEYELLFTLDAVNGYLLMFSLEDQTSPKLLNDPIKVDMKGPFSGISAKNGRICVSGGEGKFSTLRYSKAYHSDVTEWVFVPHKGFTNVLLDDTGTLAFISTHFSGLLRASFGTTIVAFQSESGPQDDDPVVIDVLKLPDFPTSNPPGSTTPSNFPLTNAISEDLQMLVTAYRDGVVITDISKLSNIHEITTIDLGQGYGVNVAVHNRSAFVVSVEPSRLTEIDLTSLQIVNQTLSKEPTDIDVSDEYVTVAAHQHDLIILER